MKKVLLAGATGHLGREIARELCSRGYELTVLVRSEPKGRSLAAYTGNYFVGDACYQDSLRECCQGQDVVISAMGKSVSLNDRSRQSFDEVDLQGNGNLLGEALRSGVKKFVYVSALHTERYAHLTYFRVHGAFAESLQRSGIDYSIIKPPAIFSALQDLLLLARQGRLAHLGPGDKKTNPIYEGDLAKVCVDAIDKPNAVMEAGGPRVYTRRQINELVQQRVDPAKTIRTVPLGLVKAFLPTVKLFSRNTYDKLSFYLEVMRHDAIAPPLGTLSFEEYLDRMAEK